MYYMRIKRTKGLGAVQYSPMASTCEWTARQRGSHAGAQLCWHIRLSIIPHCSPSPRR